MHGIIIGVVALIYILLLLQAIRCFIRAEQASYTRCLGLLTFVLVGLGVIIQILLISGVLVISPEFGIVMVQGLPALFGLSFILMILALGASLGWHVARSGTGQPRRLLWLLLIGIIDTVVSEVYCLPCDRAIWKKAKTRGTDYPIIR